MKITTKIEKALAYTFISIIRPARNKWASDMYVRFLKRWGVQFVGRPAYISSTGVKIDSTDYSLVTIGDGVTISSYIRILTHDWSPFTIGKSMGVDPIKPLGRLLPISIGNHSFIGTGSILMPGTSIGCGCLIGAGTVVRGEIPDYSIVIGSPGQIVGDTREYMAKKFPEYADTILETAGSGSGKSA